MCFYSADKTAVMIAMKISTEFYHQNNRPFLGEKKFGALKPKTTLSGNFNGKNNDFLKLSFSTVH